MLLMQNVISLIVHTDKFMHAIIDLTSEIPLKGENAVF